MEQLCLQACEEGSDTLLGVSGANFFSFLFRMGMGCIVDLRQMLEIQGRINLGGADGGVPKHFPLNGFTGIIYSVLSESD